ncbi:MAG: NgoPII family restriction endonuclease [Ruminococcus sp.]
MANTIKAILNLIKDPQLELGDYYNSRHRANGEGDSLEEYVKDLYAGTLRESNEQDRLKRISEVFSYIGNDSNPPDAMLYSGDAIEVKKIESVQGDIQLNSSHPKCKLYSDSRMITEGCRNAENGDWVEKDLLYIVGSVKNKKLKSMFMVYGIDYAATEETYLRIKRTIKEGVEGLPGIQFAETDELGRLNKVDPLGITSLRIRGMWILKNPWKAFSYITQLDTTKKFEFCAIINREKYNSFDESMELDELGKHTNGLIIQNVKIKNPNNPAMLIDAKMIRFTI